MNAVIGQSYWVTRGKDGELYLHDGKPLPAPGGDDYSRGYNFGGINAINLPGYLYPDLEFGDPPFQVRLLLA